MFTGLVEDIGRLARIDLKGEGGAMVIDTALPMDEVRLGDSIAVNGACLTVTTRQPGRFTVDFSRETAARTAFSAARPGDPLHLERAMRLSDRLDGHLVMGHVDAVGEVSRSSAQGDSWLLVVRCPASISRYLVEKGSIAVHGVSLTINAVHGGAGGEDVELTIVPLTQKRTFLTRLTIGQAVNLEADLIGKYVERLLTASAGSPRRGGLTLEALARSGFVGGGGG